ncbi:hypothetical protein AGMMS49593_03160 [Endomicrobiia bacterium]|nr:hypothetical protein AGMMS49593_03160 [Endomicrobiia bacterium]
MKSDGLVENVDEGFEGAAAVVVGVGGVAEAPKARVAALVWGF